MRDAIDQLSGSAYRCVLNDTKRSPAVHREPKIYYLHLQTTAGNLLINPKDENPPSSLHSDLLGERRVLSTGIWQGFIFHLDALIFDRAFLRLAQVVKIESDLGSSEPAMLLAWTMDHEASGVDLPLPSIDEVVSERATPDCPVDDDSVVHTSSVRVRALGWEHR